MDDRLIEDSLAKRAVISGWPALNTLLLSTDAGDQESNRPCVPFAKRWSTATLLTLGREEEERRTTRDEILSKKS